MLKRTCFGLSGTARQAEEREIERRLMIPFFYTVQEEFCVVKEIKNDIH